MIELLNNSVLVPNSQIKDYYNFLFFDGVYKNTLEKYTPQGVPNMGEKKACFSIYIEATRYNKNLKIQAKEGVFFSNVFVNSSGSVYIPFTSAGGSFGLSIYIFFWVRLENEEIQNSLKRIELHRFFTAGGAVPMKNLFFEAMKNDTENENFQDEKQVKPIFKNQNIKTDYVDYRELKYKLSLYPSGVIEVFNITKNTALSPASPMAKKIINLSIFSEKE